MTVFGFIWIWLIIFFFLQRDIVPFIALTLFSMALQSVDVIQVDQLSVGPQLLTSFACIIKVYVHMRGKLVFHRSDKAIWSSAVLLLGAAVISCTLNGILATKILDILQLAVYMMCFLFLRMVCNQITAQAFYRILRTIVIFLLIVGIVQVLTTMQILPLRNVLKMILYNDDSVNVMFNRSYYNRVTSTFMEPSYFSGLLVGCFYYFLSQTEKIRENFSLLVCMFLELLFTRSSTGYGAFLVIGVVFLLFERKIGTWEKLTILLVALIVGMVLFLGFYDLLDKVLFSKSDSASSIVRSGWNRRAIRAFQFSPWVGIGYENCRGSSIVLSLLGQMGVIGLTAWGIFNLKLLSPLLREHRKSFGSNTFFTGTGFALLAVIICQIIACPDLDLCTYWFWAYCAALAIRQLC